jgi:hypothetical protein
MYMVLPRIRKRRPVATALQSNCVALAQPLTNHFHQTSLLPTAAQRDDVVEKYGAIEGGKQTLERLGEYLATMA